MFYQVGSIILELILPEILPVWTLQAQIPGIREIHSPYIPNIKIEFICGSSHLKVTKNSLTLYGQWNETTKGDISHLVYGFLRQYWIRKGFYPVHSVMLGSNLILGHSGSGKTTLAVEALEQGLRVFSFDKTVVRFTKGELIPVLGTEIISVRAEMANNLTGLIQRGQEHRLRVLYNTPHRILLENKTPTVSEPCKNLYLYRQANIPLEIHQLSTQSSLHELYPYFMDTVKTDVVLEKLVFSGNISQVSKEKLVTKLGEWIAKGNRLTTLVGKPCDIISYLKCV